MFLLQLLHMPASLSLLLEVKQLIIPTFELEHGQDFLDLFAFFLHLYQPIVNNNHEDRLLFRVFCFQFAKIKIVSLQLDTISHY